jgi:hypothetical protein
MIWVILLMILQVEGIFMTKSISKLVEEKCTHVSSMLNSRQDPVLKELEIKLSEIPICKHGFKIGFWKSALDYKLLEPIYEIQNQASKRIEILNRDISSTLLDRFSAFLAGFSSRKKDDRIERSIIWDILQVLVTFVFAAALKICYYVLLPAMSLGIFEALITIVYRFLDKYYFFSVI